VQLKRERDVDARRWVRRRRQPFSEKDKEIRVLIMKV